MNPRIVHLFPDTNLFVQCAPLEQLEWSLVGEFDEVHLIISRPIQSEIDNQKNRGRDRLGDKARMTSRLFRDIIVAPEGKKIIKHEKPLVALSIRHEIQPDPSLAQRLDYRERDDQLVGIAYAFSHEYPQADVRVLTHDTGPMASAKMVGMAFIPIPDKWLLPPETTAAERRMTSLETEIARLKATEPSFSIAFLNGVDEAADTLEIEIVRYEALTESEVSDLISRIKTKLPLASDFGPREPSQKTGSRFGFSLPEVFVPATEKEIASYREEYPRWLGQCEKKLRSFHEMLQQRQGAPRFSFLAVNDGARPGNDVLVSVKARGAFMVMPPPYRSERRHEQTESIAFPNPPSVPRGIWKPDGVFGRYQDLMRGLGGLSGPGTVQILPGIMEMGNLSVSKHDPNAFYYKPTRASSPVSEFTLECKQWRHGVEPESFSGEIHIEKPEGSVAGALECWIHADNLSEPIVKRVPVRINIKRTGAYDSAKTRVEYLLAGINL